MNFITQTPRFWLRNFEESDAQAIFDLDSNPRVHEFLGKNPITTIDQAKQTIEKLLKQYETNGFGRWAVVEKSSGKVIGWSGLKWDKEPVNGYDGYIDVGYRFQPEYWGKGVATETATEALRFGFHQMNLPVIHGAANVENIASNRVLSKIGLKQKNRFHFEWGWHNWYSLTQEEYTQL